MILKKIYNIQKIFRFNHYLKNLIVYFPAICLPNFLFPYFFVKLLLAFISFSLVSSAVYLYNDIVDLNYDKKHPTKKFRALASGIITIRESYCIMLLLIIVSLYIAANLNNYSIILILIYFLINITYSIFYKKIPILGDIIIAFGFVLRLLVGYFIIYEYFHFDKNLILNFILLVFFTVLFFTFSKRKLEIKFNRTNNIYQRKFIDLYDRKIYSLCINISRIFAFLFYMYTIQILYTKNSIILNLVLSVSFLIFIIILFHYTKILDSTNDDNIASTILSDKLVLAYIFLFIFMLLGYFLLNM